MAEDSVIRRLVSLVAKYFTSRKRSAASGGNAEHPDETPEEHEESPKGEEEEEEEVTPSDDYGLEDTENSDDVESDMQEERLAWFMGGTPRPTVCGSPTPFQSPEPEAPKACGEPNTLEDVEARIRSLE